MKYTVSINEKSRSVTVTLADGTKGVARCCPTDKFDINTGIELALERAKVSAKAKAEKPTPMATKMTVTMLVRELEKTLPEGQMVLVGNGKEMTENQKNWLRSLVGGCSCECGCHDNEDGKWYSDDEIDDIKADAHEEGQYDGYEDGYEAGYNAAENEWESKLDDYKAAIDRICDIIDDIE